MEGWIPEGKIATLKNRLRQAFGISEDQAEDLFTHTWKAGDYSIAVYRTVRKGRRSFQRRVCLELDINNSSELRAEHLIELEQLCLKELQFEVE